MQPLTGEVLDMRTSISGEGPGLDICARGFWEDDLNRHFLTKGFLTPAPQRTGPSGWQPFIASTSRKSAEHMSSRSEKLREPHSHHWSLLLVEEWAKLLPSVTSGKQDFFHRSDTSLTAPLWDGFTQPWASPTCDWQSCAFGAIEPDNHHPSRVTMLSTWWSVRVILVTDTACLTPPTTIAWHLYI